MKLKIFKSTIYTILLTLAVQSIGYSQTTESDKEKAMDAKMAAMEAKLEVMQQKLDSIKSNDNGVYPGLGLRVYKMPQSPKAVISPKLYKITPDQSVASSSQSWSSSGSGTINAQSDAFAPNGSFSKAFDGVARSLKFSSVASDEKIQEKIKSGEIKEKIKTYSKSYNISSGDKLQIDNHYGKVTVNTWNKNEFKVDVQIRALANEDDDAQKMLDGVTIADSKDGSTVSFATKIENMGNTWEIRTNNGDTKVFRIRKTEVNYTVYIPSKNPLTITTKYSNVTLPDYRGKLTINTTYGSLVAKELSNTDNDISTHYTEVNIESLNGGNMNCSYGNMIKIGVANNLTLATNSVATDIAKVKTAGNITNRYGAGLKINNIDKNVKSLNIVSSYAPVALDVKNGNNFDFDITTRNSLNGFKYSDDNVKVISKSPADDEHRYGYTTKNYKGYVGKSNNDTKVTITTSYQPVQFL